MSRFTRSTLFRSCLLFTLALALAACGGSNPTDAPAQTSPTETSAAPAAPTSTADPAADEGGSVDVPAGETVEVTISGFAFNPDNITIKVGDSVTWVNEDYGTDHTVTADDGSFGSGVMPEAEQFTFKFDTPGTYAYYCQFHGGTGGSGMAGVITVEE